LKRKFSIFKCQKSTVFSIIAAMPEKCRGQHRGTKDVFQLADLLQSRGILSRWKNGAIIDEICRKLGISKAIFYQWKKKIGCLPPNHAKYPTWHPSSYLFEMNLCEFSNKLDTMGVTPHAQEIAIFCA